MQLLKSIAAAALCVGLATVATTAEEMKFASFMAPTHPYVAGAFQPFADKVAEATGGAVTVKLYNGGELGPGPVEQYSRVVDGVAEFAVGLPGYTAANFPLTLLAELPGVVSEAGGTQALWDHVDLLGSEYQRVALVSLWSSADNILYTRDKPVLAPADLKGMKIRVPSRNAGLVVEAWGGTPVSMPVSEIYNALQTGVIDGAMIDGTATMAFKLGEVANHLTVGMHSTNSPFFILMNRDAFDGLSPENQEAIRTVGKEISFQANQVQLKEAAAGIEKFGQLPGKTLTRLTADQAAAFNALADEVTGNVVAETGGDAQKIVDALRGQ